MKILLAAMSLDIGGAETHIVELTRALLHMGHEVVVASNGGVFVPEIEAAGGRHVKIPMHRRSPALMAKSLRLLKETIRTERPDIVHAHARIPAFLCGILKGSMGFPFVTTAHWVFSTEGALRLLTDWGDRTIAVSEDIKKYLMDNYGVPEEHINVTINGIDTEKFSPEISGEEVRREFGIPMDAPVVAHVSRLDASRADAAAALIADAQELAARVPGAVILIAGGGDVYDELARRAGAVNASLGRECVILAGPRTDINKICAAGDIFVGVSRAALEAMAAGKPVVIAGNEGYMGLFDETMLDTGIEGNFCCRGCPLMTDEALLADVTRALTLPSEEAERRAAFGRQVVLEHYSVERMAKDALFAYERARNGGRVTLSGYYGYGNAGDEAILRALIRSVRASSPEASITVLSRDPKSTEENFDCGAVPRFSPFKVSKALKNCDILISGGGSLIQDNTSTRSLLYYLGIIALAHRRGKHTFLLANGIGPVRREKNRALVKRVVDRAETVTLRDPDSLKELRDMGVTRQDLTVTADPVFSLPKPDPERTRAILRENGVTGPYIAASVRPFKGAPDYFDKFARICDEAARRFDVRIVFVNMQGKLDAAVTDLVRGKMERPGVVLAGAAAPEEIMGVIGGARAVLSMRLHALIFAARCAVPALGFVYDPKVESYLKLLSQPSAGQDGDIDADAALAALGDILDRREEIGAQLALLRDELTRRALDNDVILRKMLS